MIARLFIFVAFVCCSSAKARPNILFIQTDDQAPWALGLEHGQVRTPHMDRLFSEGMRLTNCFTVTPVCSPSRASLMTSRYGSELGIT
ncbi:MAG: sulfatase-like hydrolase/transferase, partial [Verrucomicrobiales bacterium]